MNESDGINNKDLDNGKERQSGSVQNLQDTVVELSQKVVEERLLRLFIENVFHTIFEPILILDDKLRIVLANTSYYERFGSSEKNTLQESIFSRMGNNLDTPEIRSLLSEILSSKGSISNYQVQIESSTAGIRTYLINARLFSNPEGKNEFIMLAFDDATDRIQIDEQKNNLLREMNHRVKNNLTIIQTLLKLQSREVEDEVSKGYFLDTYARVQSISLIHEMLYHATDLSSIEFQEYLSKLVKTIASSYKESRIKIDLNVPSVNLDLNNMLPLGLIITGLVTNSYKYAFPGSRSGRILIELSCLDNNDFVLTVKDDGIGLPGDFDINVSDSFGMKIVTSLVGQIGGRLEIDREGGSAFVISFRDEKQLSMSS